MRVFKLRRFVAFVYLAALGLFISVPTEVHASAGQWKLRANSPEGQDLIAYCRSAVDQDNRASRTSAPATPEQNLYWVFTNWDYLTATVIQQRLPDFERDLRLGGWVSGITCALKRRLQQLQNPGLVGGLGSAPRPNVAANPESPSLKPATSKALPAGRPAKIIAPWSPNSMALGLEHKLSPGLAAERADILASCVAPIREVAEVPPAWTPAEANFMFEAGMLDDDDMERSAEQINKQMDVVNSSQGKNEYEKAKNNAERCILQRRLAQLQGAPLISGAVDGSLNPMTIGSPNSTWRPQGKDARIIASDGKSAMDCVKLITLSDKDSMMGMGGRVLSNQCGVPVEVTWCYVDTECNKEHGAMWTVGAGRSWPVSVERQIRWAACRGANTVAFVKGSAGLRFYCSAPLGKPKK